MHKGEIIYCPRYTFPDGSQADKFLINLNDPAPGEPNLLLLTTSQQRKKLKQQGCFSNLGYYGIPKGVDFFDKEMTWVLFFAIREFSFKEELRESWKGNFETRGFLKTETINAIINCLKGSNFITIHQASLLKSKPFIIPSGNPPVKVADNPS